MYQVIARKYRPQTFQEVIGQAHVKRTLRNAISQDRLAHAYIFSGPRGTGKTTTARILAMALNCENGPTQDPDPSTPVCLEIAAGSALDVIEIDAASNRGIDSMRQLRESVQFRPVRDRYKVFIIDEAHQITPDAFNALLKTLEEPPEWMVFVLCTTEPQAIPATILSRCQHFAFQAVRLDDLVAHLRRICESEGVTAEEGALTALALAGDGSVRDALSTLDQAIAAFGQRLEAGPVRDLLGAIPSESAGRILGAIRDADHASMLGVVDELFQEGRHPQHFCGELARHFRNLLVMKLAGTDTRLVSAGAREREAASAWIEQFSEDDLTRFLNLLLALYTDLQDCTHQRFRLEVGLLKLVHAGRLAPIEEILGGLGNKPVAAPARAQTGPKPAPTASPARPKPAAAPEKPARSGLREQLVDQISESGNKSMVEALRASSVTLEGGTLRLRVRHDFLPIVRLQRPVLDAAALAVTGKMVSVRFETDGEPAGGGAHPEVAPNAARARAEANPAVQAITRQFPGRVGEVVDLRGKGS